MPPKNIDYIGYMLHVELLFGMLIKIFYFDKKFIKR